MKPPSQLTSVRLWLWVCLPVMAGCGSATYETKFNETLDTLKLETPFRDLFAASAEFPEQGLALRLPRIFDSDSKEAYALDSQTPEPRDPLLPLIPVRVQPEFLNLEGHFRTYERTYQFIDAKRRTTRRPVYCYLAIVRNAGHTGALKESIRSQLQATFDGQPEPNFGQKRDNPGVEFAAGDWTSVSLPTPDGSTIKAEKIEAAGEYLFPYYLNKHKPTIKTEIDVARFVAYVYSQEASEGVPAADVVVAWLTTFQAAAQIDLDSLAAATTGTIVVGAAQVPEPAE